MAEGIVFPLVTDLVKTLGSAVVREMGSIYGAYEELENLQSTFSAIQAVLLDAEQKKDLNHSVMDWLTKLKDVAYDADDLLDSISYQSTRRKVITEGKKAKKVRIFFSELNQIAFRREMGREIKKLRKRLDLIADEKNKYNFQQITMNQSGGNEEIESYSYVPEEEVIGREEEKEEIVKRLLEINEKENVSVDAIVGHGGLGKTTLAQSVFNHDRVKDAFDLRLWVCISEPFISKVIVENIIESATGQRPSGHEMESLQKTLRDLIDGKRYLLVMDDLWNSDVGKWADLNRLLMGGAKGSKILITTRTKLVAEASQATSSYILDDLSESNSWILFERIALKNCEEPIMIQIGQEIAKKCFGSPLVIRTIGGLLSLKRSEAEWLSFKNYDLAIMTRQENGITQRLKLSYNHLPSHLKPCFAYCSLFPKDHLFEKVELIQLWVAEGFVEPRGENKCLDSIGNEYFMELIRRSIFQDIGRNEYGDVFGCKMHDLIHDLAQFVAGREYFSADSNIKNVNRQTRRVMYDCSSRENWSLLSTPQLKHDKLRTLLLPRYFEELNETGLEAHMSSLKSLHVLDLHGLGLKKVSSSIGTLKHLRFLNLSDNDEIESLPSSLTKLHNLRTLNISFCSTLKELPEDIGSLINLRELDISECYFIQRLPNSITKLKFLQILILSRTRLKELPDNIGNMLDLRLLSLVGIKCIELLPNSICNLQKLQKLNLRYCTSLRELPRDVSNLVNLKHLILEGCVGLRGMPLGLNKLTSLQTIGLYVVDASVSAEGSGLWQLDTLINIKGRLHIRGLHHLRKNASRANTVTLKDNHGVRDLTLEWTKIGYNPNGVDPDSVVLEKLHPNKKVKKLRIDGYGGVRLSSWVASLSNLTHVSIENCERLQYVPQMDRLPNLQNLCLDNNNLIEYMDNNETVEEFGSSIFFPSLLYLTLRNMDKLKGWWKPREFSPEDPSKSFSLPSFHCLVDLKIDSCPQLLSIPSPDSSLKTLYLSYSNDELLKGELIGSGASLEDDTQPREALGGRDDLHSEGVTKVETPREVSRHLTALQSLSINGYIDLLVLPDWIGNLTTLHKLNIEHCPKLTLLSDGIGNFTALQKLKIDNCPELISLPDGIGNLTALQDLDIVSCPELYWISNLTSLRELKIHDCPQLNLFPDGICNLTSLQKLAIDECSKLTLLLDQICNLTSTQKIEIRNCPKVTRLQGGNGQLSSLRRLITSGGCRRPEKRWTKQIGEDWSEISPGKFIRISK